MALNGIEIPRTAREERTCPAYWTLDLCTILDLYLVLGLNCSITRGADAHACLTMVRHSQSVRNAPKGLETTAGTDWKLERPESMRTCLTMPSASMRATPMPALPAPTSTMRCWASSLLLLPCTRSAPYTPATAVAAVPCKRNGSVLMPEQDLCFHHIYRRTLPCIVFCSPKMWSKTPIASVRACPQQQWQHQRAYGGVMPICTWMSSLKQRW